MPFEAGFAEVDMTPSALPIEKAGWLQRKVAESVLDPVRANIAVFGSGQRRVGIVSLDLLSVPYKLVKQIRECAAPFGIDGARCMVAATHNHAGPAVTNVGETKRDEDYIETLLALVTKGFEDALQKLRPARLMEASCTEGRVSFTRRYVMKDGSVMTHPPQGSPEMCYAESVIDPQMHILCVKDMDEQMMGILVNFACHPTHHGGGDQISAGFPGQLSREIHESISPDCVTLFLNGACGDIHHVNPLDPEQVDSPEYTGKILCQDIQRMQSELKLSDSTKLASVTTTLKVPYRDIDGPYGIDAPSAQRFGGDNRDRIYEDSIERLRRKVAERDHALLEIQAMQIGDVVYVTVPAEYFSSFGLKIKERSALGSTCVVTLANGIVGYVPTRTAFDRGGYEPTLGQSSKLCPEAGDMIMEAALATIGQLKALSGDPVG